MKQTAIEWLLEQCPRIETVSAYNILEQAKAIEKQQIIDAFIGGDVSLFNETPEHYYNVTFKDSI